MTDTPRSDYDAAAADLVVRTLRAVAEATPIDSKSIDFDPMVVSLARADIARSIRRRRRARWLVGVTAAAAAALVFAVVWARDDGWVETSPSDGAIATDPPPSTQMAPGWLPEGFPAELTEITRSPGLGMRVEGALLQSPASGAEIVAVSIESGHQDGDANVVMGQHIERVRMAVEGVFRPPDVRHIVTDSAGRRGPSPWPGAGRRPPVPTQRWRGCSRAWHRSTPRQKAGRRRRCPSTGCPALRPTWSRPTGATMACPPRRSPR